MKSIEERAREHASSIAGGIYHGGLRGSVYEHNYHNYIQIANEQADITKKEMIENVVKFLSANQGNLNYIDEEGNLYSDGFIEDLIKHLE